MSSNQAVLLSFTAHTYKFVMWLPGDQPKLNGHKICNIVHVHPGCHAEIDSIRCKKCTNPSKIMNRAITWNPFLTANSLKTMNLGGVCGATLHKHPLFLTFTWEQYMNMRLPYDHENLASNRVLHTEHWHEKYRF